MDYNSFRVEPMMIAAIILFIVGALLTLLGIGLLSVVHRRSSQSAPMPMLPMQDLTTPTQAAQLLATAAEG
jgi:hypothetical protein